MEIRFPDVDWFCDNCDAYLNKQRNFDDRKYIWKCKKCGYKNSISATNIRYENPILHNVMGFILGYIRSFLVYTIAILFISEIISKQKYVSVFGYRVLFLSVAFYPVLIVLSLFFERVIAKYGVHKPLGKWIGATVPAYVFGDFLRPLQEVLGFPLALLNLIRLKLKGITFKKYFQKKCLYAIAYLCLLIVVFVLFWKSGIWELFT